MSEETKRIYGDLLWQGTVVLAVGLVVVLCNFSSRVIVTPAAEVSSTFYAAATNATTAEAISEFTRTNGIAYLYSNTLVLGEGVNITNLTAQQHEPPTVEWIGHPSVVVKNRQGRMEDGWATEVEIGMRSDGVVVWRKVKAEK